MKTLGTGDQNAAQAAGNTRNRASDSGTGSSDQASSSGTKSKWHRRSEKTPVRSYDTGSSGTGAVSK